MTIKDQRSVRQEMAIGIAFKCLKMICGREGKKSRCEVREKKTIRTNHMITSN